MKVVEEFLSVFTGLRTQARRALLAESTKDVIARNRREEKRALYLYLHTDGYYISGLSPRRKWMLAIRLPYADEPRPLLRLAVLTDVRLTERVMSEVSRLAAGRKGKSVKVDLPTSSLAEELFGSPHRTVA